MPEVTVTLKQSGGYDAPWVVFKGGSVAEVKSLMLDARDLALLAETKKMAAEFKANPKYPIVDKAAVDKAEQVLKDASATEAEHRAALARAEGDLDKAEAALKAAGLAGSREARDATLDKSQAGQELPGSLKPSCAKCSQAAQWREGTSKAGTPYAGYFCLNNDCENFWKECK